MLGIQYSFRDQAGHINTGTLSLSEASETISVYGVEDISLNMSASSITGYVRQGDDLILQLVGGKTIVLDGYFEGGDKELLLSERGLMSRVVVDGEADGVVAAAYEDIDLTGKWSDYDQLAFLDLERVEPVVAPVVGALGLSGLGAAAAGAAGLAALTGGGDGDENGGGDDDTGNDGGDDDTGGGDDTGDDDGDDDTGGDDGDAPDTTAPEVTITGGVESTDDLVNGEDYDSGEFTITGEGEPGTTVDVTVEDTTITTVVGEDGTWVADFDSDTIETGEYETDVTVTITDEAGNSTTVTDTLVVDTEAEDLTFDTVEGDDVINAAEASDDVVVSGQSEAGATVVVELEGQTLETIVGDDGTWSVTFSGADLPGGTYDTTVTATVTDAAGNAATYTHDLHVDLETSVTMDASTAGGDGTVNMSEMTSGVSLSGTGEPGAEVVVTIAGVSRSATVGGDGSWTVQFESGTLPEGTYTAEAVAVITDLAGNTATTTGSFDIDTEMGVAIASGHSGGDETINLSESQQDMSFAGTAEPGATVVVTLGGVSLQTVANDSGEWTVTYPAGTLAGGEYDTTLTAVATDAAGNTATTTSTVHVDTVAGDIALSSNPIEGDNVINAAEASDGVWVTGTATAGHTVEVTLGGVTHTVTSTQQGTFAAFFAAGEVPAGEYDTTATATIFDDAGNSKTVQTSVEVDTYVRDFAETEVQGGADGVVNAAEAAGGLPLGGTVEPGSTVVVSFGGQSYAANVDAQGNWSATIPAGALPSGEGDMDVLVSATDAAGNTASLTETIGYDTLVNALDLTADAGGDMFLNLAEVNAGATLTGVVEPGSTVFVTLGGVRQQASVDAQGNWTATFAPGDIAEGTYDADVLIEATDAAGNTRSETTSITVDTEIDEPVVVALTRGTDGVRAVFTEDNADSISVHAVAEDGSVSEVSYSEIDLGSETLLNFGSDVANGDQIVIAADDTAGNASDTLLALDTGTTRPDGTFFTVDIDNAGLDGFELGAIDLQFVNGGEVTLSASDLARLTGADGSLTIHGGADDRVVLEGGTATGDTATVDGETYNIYTLGDDHQVMVDAEIDVVLP